TYPARPVTFVVPFAPGGGTEFLARLLGQRLEQRLGKPFVIENRPGGGGVTGALSVARAAPDGYTILMAPSPVMAINVALHKRLPYDPAVDFVPIALVVATPYVLVVTPSLSVQSVADLVELAKAKPSQLSFASAGLGTPHHLFAQLFKSMTGVEMTHVPYRGSVPALSDVAAGHVQLMFCDIPPALGLINEGKVRGLGVSTKERVAALPGISSIAEQGLAGFDAASWQMVVAPAATPEGIVQRLHARSRISWCSRRSRNTPSRWACSRSTRPRSPACASSCRQRSHDGAKSWSRPESPARNETPRAPLVSSRARRTSRACRQDWDTAMNTPLLSVRGVKAYYGHIAALRGVDVDIREGEIVAVIGANGAGKSTLMMTIFGNPRAREGRITFAGRDITQLPTHEIARLKIAQAPEGRRIFVRMTVMENLQMGSAVADAAHFQSDVERVFGLFPRLKERI